MAQGGGSRTGVVLAGGHSSRFGDREKALAELDGEPLLGHAVRALAPVVGAVVVSCRRDQRPAFGAALDGAPVDATFACDPTPDCGPAAGLATALAAAPGAEAAVVGCDMPFADGALLDWLFDALDDSAAVVSVVDGHPQPLHAVYRTDPARRAARGAVADGSGSLRAVLDRLDAVEVPESRALARTSRRSFTDVDTPAALDAAREDH
ncbi:molybdenum cofactor guanylyltransferase [Halobacterium yunchengense]|uniref:molybdenum cofactor guanylyltransferase n=1 Tax=Halobacterium yunchengense TaxID=3108497 RepID=UPI00300B4A44